MCREPVVAPVAVSFPSVVTDLVLCVFCPAATRDIPSLRDILKMPAIVMKKPAEKELKDDHLLKP